MECPIEGKLESMEEAMVVAEVELLDGVSMIDDFDINLEMEMEIEEQEQEKIDQEQEEIICV